MVRWDECIAPQPSKHRLSDSLVASLPDDRHRGLDSSVLIRHAYANGDSGAFRSSTGLQLAVVVRILQLARYWLCICYYSQHGCSCWHYHWPIFQESKAGIAFVVALFDVDQFCQLPQRIHLGLKLKENMISIR